jgi:3-oxoacyl-(acyl-carrier-protein) synthase
MNIYIQAAEQISVQQPLSDSWFYKPVLYHKVYVPAVEPDYRNFIAPNKARRLGRILKRAIATSQRAAQNSGISMPDAVISGTGLGCVENTEYFLMAMAKNGEEFLQPTHFMQSTHNTISSFIAIELKCHGYNSTYAHKGISFDSALADACIQFHAGKIQSALVGGYDEMTPNYHLLLSRIGYWRADGGDVILRRGEEAFSGENSVSFMLSAEKTARSLCCLSGTDMIYRPSGKQLQETLAGLLQNSHCSMEDIDAVMLGTGGNPQDDAVYRAVVPELFPGKILAGWKHIFGESYTASATGTYAASLCLQKGEIPEFLLSEGRKKSGKLNRILIYHQYANINHSFILLTSC